MVGYIFKNVAWNFTTPRIYNKCRIEKQTYFIEIKSRTKLDQSTAKAFKQSKK